MKIHVAGSKGNAMGLMKHERDIKTAMGIIKVCVPVLVVSVVFALPTFVTTAFAEETGTVAVPVPKPDEIKREPVKVAEEKAERPYQSACPAVLSGRVKAMPLLPIVDGICGERSPIKVSAIGAVELSAPATLNCRMATALAKWIPKANELSVNLLDSPVTKLQTSTSYQCRRRNNATDGKVSEHGFANALDIAGFELESGKNINVLIDWPLSVPLNQKTNVEESSEPPESDKEAEFLRLVHKAACKQFTTVLGPDSDSHHADHFHFDLGCHGKRCTYTICE